MRNWAAIFDWDGVIIHSASQHEESWRQLAAENGRDLPPDFFLKGFGMKNEAIIPRFLGWTINPERIRELSLRKEELYREIIRRQGITALPGVSSWLRQLNEAHVPCAVGSSTPRQNIEFIIDRLGLTADFQAIIASEDVTRGKPEPEVFLLAANKLGVQPTQCVVFEDAHVGIAAARAAQMKVIALATTHLADTLQEADLVVADLSELRLEDVDRLMNAP